MLLRDTITLTHIVIVITVFSFIFTLIADWPIVDATHTQGPITNLNYWLPCINLWIFNNYRYALWCEPALTDKRASLPPLVVQEIKNNIHLTDPCEKGTIVQTTYSCVIKGHYILPEYIYYFIQNSVNIVPSGLIVNNQGLNNLMAWKITCAEPLQKASLVTAVS